MDISENKIESNFLITFMREYVANGQTKQSNIWGINNNN